MLSGATKESTSSLAMNRLCLPGVWTAGRSMRGILATVPPEMLEHSRFAALRCIVPSFALLFMMTQALAASVCQDYSKYVDLVSFLLTLLSTALQRADRPCRIRPKFGSLTVRVCGMCISRKLIHQSRLSVARSTGFGELLCLRTQ